ncbi:MAG: nickel pincer cofactor biosynthesis protein LarB [Planctomycetaceae bacterium]
MPSPEPSEDILRQQLAGLYPNTQELERAVAGLRSLGLVSGVPASARGADIDLLRRDRCGFPEVVFGPGKPPELVVDIFRQQRQAGQDSLVTRISQEQAAAVKAAFPDAIHSPVAGTIRLCSDPSPREIVGPVLVVTAGSSDRPVAEEALETLRWMHVRCSLIEDAGVAGPHRFPQHLPRLREAAVVVCVAGMEAALPAVLGGFVACPVIGVPTSVGYGASLQGLTALLSMLTCCASNVVCVNIDAGFRGGYVAGLMAAGRQPK